MLIYRHRYTYAMEKLSQEQNMELQFITMQLELNFQEALHSKNLAQRVIFQSWSYYVKHKHSLETRERSYITLPEPQLNIDLADIVSLSPAKQRPGDFDSPRSSTPSSPKASAPRLPS